VRLAELTLVPEAMQSSSVERAFLLKPGIGYLRVASFDANTGQQIAAAIEKIGGRSLQGLVLDLRNNPGGVMTAALETASLFLQPEQEIMRAKGRNVPETIERVPAEAHPYAFSLAVIMNGKSASASEIVAGTLQDHDRAVIVGEPSFGKGLVQSVFPLSDKNGLALTTALYYIPSGRSIQKPFARDEFELQATARRPNERADFRTDKGRAVPGGGGIVPDLEALPPAITPFRAAMEASGSFTEFATEFLRDNKVTDSWDVPPQLLDRFQVWLAEHRIQPSLREYLAEREFIRIRLKTEIFNLALGVEKGDEIDAQRDTQIQKALEAVQSPRR
jgi:carboxyl-terminal processing protease